MNFDLDSHASSEEQPLIPSDNDDTACEMRQILLHIFTTEYEVTLAI
jgi:hypothetical protein